MKGRKGKRRPLTCLSPDDADADRQKSSGERRLCHHYGNTSRALL